MLKLSNLRTLPHTVMPTGERRIESAPNRNIRYIALGSMLLTLLFLIACGSAAPAEQVVVEKEVVKEVPKEVVVEKEVVKEVEVTKIVEVRPEGMKPAQMVAATVVPEAKPEPTAVPAMTGAKRGGFITFMDYNAPTQKAIWEWAGSQLKNTSPVFNGLLEFNPETDDPLDIRGDLAESWEQTGPTTYVFYLRQNATWHDGKPVTAEDIVFSMDGGVCADCNGLDGIQGATRSGAIFTDNYYEAGMARAIDQYTVEVETLFPAPAFIPTLSLDVFKMLPKHTVLGERKAQTIKTPEDFNGSGPFLHKKYTKDVQNEYEANPNYWKEGYPSH